MQMALIGSDCREILFDFLEFSRRYEFLNLMFAFLTLRSDFPEASVFEIQFLKYGFDHRKISVQKFGRITVLRQQQIALIADAVKRSQRRNFD